VPHVDVNSDDRPRLTRVVVLFGGRTADHAASVSSAATVIRNLDRSRYTVIPIRITTQGRWSVGYDIPAHLIDEISLHFMTPEPELSSPSFFEAIQRVREADVVLPVLHGPYGRDSTVQGVLEHIGVPYVGSGPLSGAVARNRDLTQALLGDNIAVRADGTGREVNVGVLEMPDGRLLAAPPLELRVEKGYRTRYRRALTQHVVPAGLDVATTARIQEQSVRAFRLLGCAGLLRVDFFVGAGGELTVNEVKAMPELTAMAQFPRMWQAAGLPYGELIDLLIRTARRRAAQPTPVP